jgi:hypothetical protein
MNVSSKRECQPRLTGVDLIAISEEISSCFPRPISDTLIALMDVDPYTIHAYWNIAPSEIETVRIILGDDALKDSLTLRFRLLKLDAQSSDSGFFDCKIQGIQSSAYVKVDAETSCVAELGILASDGAFFELAMSNLVVTPPDYRSSQESDHQEAKGRNKNMEAEAFTVDHGEISVAASIVNTGNHSAACSYTFSEDHKEGVEADLEFRVFGRVDHRALLTVAGERVRVRPDGSFSHRIPVGDKEDILSRLNIGIGRAGE